VQRADRLLGQVDQLEADLAVSERSFHTVIKRAAACILIAGTIVFAVISYDAVWEPHLPAGHSVLLKWQVLAIAGLLCTLIRSAQACTASFSAMQQTKARLDCFRSLLAEELARNM
jgi:hypothetical protein